MTPDELLTEATRVGLQAEAQHVIAAVHATVDCAIAWAGGCMSFNRWRSGLPDIVVRLLAEHFENLSTIVDTPPPARDGRITREQALEVLRALQLRAQELLPPLLAVTRPGEWPR